MTDTKTDTWMPLWIGAYLADTMSFTTVQHGAYLLLILAYWRERAPLPDDDDTLRGITKLDRADWKRVRPVLARKFRVADGVWWHKRVEHEMAAADARAKKASEKAAKAAQARWKDAPEHPPSNAPSISQAMHEDMRDECPPPSPSSLSDEPNGSSSSAEPTSRPRRTEIPPPYADIVEAYHSALPDLPKARLMTEPRKRLIGKVWRWVLTSKKSDGTRRATNAEEALAWFAGYFARAAQNDFITGRGPRSAEHANWRADIDYLMSDKGMKQVIEKTQEQAA